MASRAERTKRRWSEIQFGIRWRSYLAHLPRCVPRPVLRITCPEGPYPFIVRIPSRYPNHQIPVWTFLPPENTISTPDVPVHIDFHGGGFIMGGPFEQAPFCAKIARERGCIVLSPDYSIGPLYQFPAALEDAEDVLSAVLDSDRRTDAGETLHSAIAAHRLPRRRNYREPSDKTAGALLRADPSRLSLSGFSSGGNLALNLSLSIELDDGQRFPCRVPPDSRPFPVFLFYPQFDQRMLSYDRPAPADVPRPGKLGASIERRLVPTYLPDRLRGHPRASPGLVSPLAIHPKAQLFVVLAEKDTLTYQSNEWVQKVRDAGMGDRIKVFQAPGMKHGFINLPELWLGTRAFRLKRNAYIEMMSFWDEVAARKVQDQDAKVENLDPEKFHE